MIASLVVPLGFVLGCQARTVVPFDDAALPSPSCAGDSLCAPAVRGPAPRLLFPLSTARVVSNRPTFRWSAPPGALQSRLELYGDRSCAEPLLTMDTRASSAALEIALAPGVYFWRVTADLEGGNRSPSSAVWEFGVGPRASSAAGPGGLLGDLNGDGFGDLVIVSPNESEPFFVYLGSDRGLPERPSRIIPSPQDPPGPWSVLQAGDLNGDGFGDMVAVSFGTTSAAPWSPRFWIFPGSIDGLASTAAATRSWSTGPDMIFPPDIASAGDVDGDGYADLVFGIPFALGPDADGTIDIFTGDDALLTDTARWSLLPADSPRQWHALRRPAAAAADLDGDGYSDVVLNNVSGAPCVFRGSRTGPSPWQLGTTVGDALMVIADVNGDGRPDLVASSADEQLGVRSLDLYLGAPTGPASTPTRSIAAAWSGTTVPILLGLDAGDTNGDGFDDVVAVWLDGPNGERIWTEIYTGGPDGLSAASRQILESPFPAIDARDHLPLQFGTAHVVRDFDGDGLADLALGAPLGPSDRNGMVAIYYASASGFPAAPSQILARDGSPRDRFGAALANRSVPSVPTRHGQSAIRLRRG